MDSERTVFVVDDDIAARESIVDIVRLKGCQAQGFASAEEFLAQYNPAQKGCVVVDVRMSGMSGLDLLLELKSRKSPLPVVMITGYADVALAVQAMRAGAVSFLEKPCREAELWQEIRQALEIEQTEHARRKQRSDVEARLASLTEEEVVVLRRLLEGHPNKRIASDMDLGLRTVEMRRSNVMRKMQAASMAELVRMAILAEFLKPESSP
jgi:two-component system, LuxR family, response regulator FixJ